MPTQADLRAAFGSKVVDHPDGSYTCDLKTVADRKLWAEIKRPWNRTAAEVLAENNAAVERVRMRSRVGPAREVPADLIETCERHGLRIVLQAGRHRRRLDGSDYDPNARLRSAAEIRWGSDE